MSQSKSETQTNGRNPNTGRFLTGNNGGGRPRCSRNKLGEQFLSDVYAEWEKSGPDALRKMAASDPGAFCKMVANILPSKVDATVINTNILREVADFRAAYKLAKYMIGAVDPPIELEAIPVHEPDDD